MATKVTVGGQEFTLPTTGGLKAYPEINRWAVAVSQAVGSSSASSGGVFSVMDPAYGAVGDGVTDDTAAINAAIEAAIEAGGGTVFFPKPELAYRVTEQIVVGHKWLNEEAIFSRSDPDVYYPDDPSYDGAAHTLAGQTPPVGLAGDLGGSAIWGDFEAEEKTAIVYYGINSAHSHINFGGGVIQDLVFLSKENIVNGAFVAEPGGPPEDTDLPEEQNQVGLAYPGSNSITITRCSVRDCRVGFLTNDSYWANVSSCRTWHCDFGFYCNQVNASTYYQLRADYSPSIGFTFSAQVLSLTSLNTTSCYQDLWLPYGEHIDVNGTYFEEQNHQEGYGFTVGDPDVEGDGTPAVRFSTFTSMHISRNGAKLVQLHGCYATFARCRAVRGGDPTWLFDEGVGNNIFLMDTGVEPEGDYEGHIVSITNQNGEMTFDYGEIAAAEGEEPPQVAHGVMRETNTLGVPDFRGQPVGINEALCLNTATDGAGMHEYTIVFDPPFADNGYTFVATPIRQGDEMVSVVQKSATADTITIAITNTAGDAPSERCGFSFYAIRG